jgi:hypothetical protein
MINGAKQIIGAVPGIHLDPLLLVQSQSGESTGFIMIGYQRHTGLEQSAPSTFFDLFFFRGPEIYDCARMNQDVRFQLQLDVALETFRRHRTDHGALVYLFTSSADDLRRFQSTLYYEPCLKIQLEGLSRKRISLLLKTTGCQRGIIECNGFDDLAPSVDLQEISSFDDIAQYRPPLKRGRLLLYDIEKNKELVSQRHTHDPSRLSLDLKASPNPKRPEIDSHYSTTPPFHPGDIPAPTGTDHDAEAVDEKEAAEFAQFLKRILDSPPTLEPQASQVEEPGPQQTPRPRFIIARHDDKRDSEITADAQSGSTGHKRSTASARKTHPRKPRVRRSIPLSVEKEVTTDQKHESPTETGPPSTEPRPPVQSNATPSHTDYVRLFERLLRSYRQQVFDCFGSKSETIISEAEHKVRFLTPEFNLHDLKSETAIVVLDLVETLINDAPLFKKSKLRQAALTLVADVYNRHYELLEQHQAIDKVEQSYYRLKR